MRMETCPPVFVINMPADADRRVIMTERLKTTKVPYSFFEAVNGRGIDIKNAPYYDSSKRCLFFGRDMMPGELGCLLSHRAIYEKMDHENIPYAVVLEDDVIFEDGFHDTLMALMKTPVHWDVIRFLGSPKIYARGCRKIAPLINHYWLARLPTAPGGAHGYLLSLHAARVMLKHMEKNWVPIDTLQGRTWQTGLETLVLHPAPLHPDQTAASTIGDKRFDKTVQLTGWKKQFFPVFRSWFKLCENMGKRYVYLSALPRDIKHKSMPGA